MRARPLGILAALIMIAFSLGVAMPAQADPGGNSTDNGNGNSAAAHEKNEDRKAEASGSSQASAGAEADSSSVLMSSAGGGGDSTTASDRGNKSVKASGSGKAKKSTKGNGGSKAASHKTVGTSGTSGVATEEQPVSNADQNKGGANGQCADDPVEDTGPYCSTRDGKASGNGNDRGEAKGKPCAGCVGKADNKNPPGQMPNGRDDGNNGYECDDNNGVGHGKDKKSAGNPAHTGCVPTTVDKCVPEPGEDENCNKIDDKCVPKPGEDKNCNKIDDECVPTQANDFCDEETPPGGNPPPGPEGNPPPVIGGEEEFGNPRPPAVAGVQQFAGPPPAAAPQAGVLPATGASSVMAALTTLGLGLLLMGGALVGLRRGRVTPTG